VSGGAIDQPWDEHKQDRVKGWRITNPLAKGGHGYKRETVGWEPGCDCSEVVARNGDLVVEPLEALPCTVLDPFGGTMTVGQVCVKHGRHFVGLDLKREYVEMGRERCATVQTAYAL